MRPMFGAMVGAGGSPKVKLNSLLKICNSLFWRASLACDIDFKALSNVPGAFFFKRECERFLHILWRFYQVAAYLSKPESEVPETYVASGRSKCVRRRMLCCLTFTT